MWLAPKTFQILDFYQVNLPKTFKRNIVNPPNSSYFLSDTIKLVQFYIYYYFDPIHKILVPPSLWVQDKRVLV